jgi:hypothetical protein
VNSGETWYVQLLLSYSGSNANSDYKCGFTFPTGTGWVSYVGDSTTADLINLSTGIRISAATSLTAIALGTDGANTPRTFTLQMMINATANGTVQFQFANNAAAASRTSTTRAGSTLMARKLG